MTSKKPHSASQVPRKSLNRGNPPPLVLKRPSEAPRRRVRALGVAVAAAMAFFVTLAHAQRRDDALDLARCLWAEAGRTPSADWPAILHVLERRTHLPAWRGKTAGDVARAYCVALSGRAQNARAKRIRVADRDEVPAAALRLADAWVEGSRPADPCGGEAIHWDGVDHPGQRRVDCGATTNVFFAPAR